MKEMDASKGNGDTMVSMFRLAWKLVQAGKKVGVYWLRHALGVPMINKWYFNMELFCYAVAQTEVLPLRTRSWINIVVNYCERLHLQDPNPLFLLDPTKYYAVQCLRPMPNMEFDLQHTRSSLLHRQFSFSSFGE